MFNRDLPFWPDGWSDPSRRRQPKPRATGLTMVIDKGMGRAAFYDLMELAAPYIDIYKLGFGTSVLYPGKFLQQKVEEAKTWNLHIMPGGTLFEIALCQSTLEAYIEQVKAIGFNAVEISDGTFPLPADLRKRAISTAADAGLIVYSEFGKKSADFRAEQDELLRTLEADLLAGASYVIVEARESGTVGVFDGKGKVETSFLLDIHKSAGSLADRLIWEAPQKEQQVALIQTLGASVNLGNIAGADVLAVETLRRGLRGDTAAMMAERRAATCE
ncbi:phosphosulfolactate synthase [Brevibacillus borstelensis]|uniref:phosphosulfolactate synthase n=1 Tax=Brevibacillus TaxID=55080 RepID=UPI000F097C29|nr:phosphosulfolactate synthase [Brevibacillus borstelensis]MBE5394662.1 phosphosulfolactate synthase [Brevibacillus borstelensis]MED1746923.1 phosphosulfolactate synthase [Brevibacillus borstelensis]MED1882439.1 phosphosulfolactate synthase [Brevibacillus borstelensis]RNB62401.1 phosphosulfolactate synthase [Brevibacillus borstelensis]WNF03823.1 phosphosulfolactate synthase [Brevibacillus borstelensis]